MEKKQWDKTAQTLYEIWDKVLLGLKSGRYITLQDYEYICDAMQKRIEQPEG